MLCPVSKYVKSNRMYTETLQKLNINRRYTEKVQSCGQISFENKNYFIGEYLKR